MRLGIRTKQVAGVMAIVGLALVVLGGWYLASLTSVLLESSRSRAQLLSNLIYQRTFTVLDQPGEPFELLRADSGLRTILEGQAYSENMVYASICDPGNRIVVDGFPDRVGLTLDPRPSLDDLIETAGPMARLRAIYTAGSDFELRQSIMSGSTELASIRIGVSAWLLRDDFINELRGPIYWGVGILLGSFIVAGFLAQLVLKPIHVIRSGLARLGRGELDVNVDLPKDAELSDLGDSFRQVTARMAEDRNEGVGKRALESVVDRLEDAVALVSTTGTLLFSNAAMRPVLGLPDPVEATPAGGARPALASLLPEGHPYLDAVSRALKDGTREGGPVQVPGAGERLVLTNTVRGADGRPMGVLLVSRDIALLNQMESTLSYSRKLSALNRLTAGIAHEIKNPLNATMIHLELMKLKLAERPEALEHVAVIANQVRRLDEVVQGFLKFTRPEDLHLEPVALAPVFEGLRPIIDAESGTTIEVAINVPATLPPVEGDSSLLEQAFLNLALNACQAMPDGGRLTISARQAPGRRVLVEVEDTGVGIAPEHLSRIFDLYFTTKKSGSGIGLSLVFRTVQMHNGEIEVQSKAGSGTTFRVHLREASESFRGLGAS
jgi:signal transduction histidine kinase